MKTKTKSIVLKMINYMEMSDVKNHWGVDILDGVNSNALRELRKII